MSRAPLNDQVQYPGHRPMIMPDPEAPYDNAPPLLTTDPGEVADLAPLETRNAQPHTSRRSGQDPHQVTADFMAWRERWRRRDRAYRAPTDTR